jgi:hypothetical protein
MPIARSVRQYPNSPIQSLQLTNGSLAFRENTLLKNNTEALAFGIPVVYDSTTSNATITPMTATTADAGVTWTLNGTFAGFVNAIAGETAETVRLATQGILNSDMLEAALVNVSQTDGEVYTVADLLKIVTINAGLLDGDYFGGVRGFQLQFINGVA